MIIVVKVGSSTLTLDSGDINLPAVKKLCLEIGKLIDQGNKVVVVSSAATSLGLTPLGFSLEKRPSNPEVLSAAASIGQISVTSSYSQNLSEQGRLAAQILLAPIDFWNRKRYVKARKVLQVLLEKNVVPIINENDALADDEISFGDNDNLAALVAHLVSADKLILLTDIDGFYSDDPRKNPDAVLVPVIEEFSDELAGMARGSSSSVGRGGMSSKLLAAQIASWSGVETVICRAGDPDVLFGAVAETTNIGTTFRASKRKPMSARKLWIAFAVDPVGTVWVDRGAKKALTVDNKSLLAAGIVKSQGKFHDGDVVEIVDEDNELLAKGIVGWSSNDIETNVGKHSSVSPDLPDAVIHQDDLVVMPR